MNAKLVLSLVLLGMVLLFTAQNYQVVEVRFLFLRLEMSRALLLLFVLGAGIAIGWALSSARRRSRRSPGVDP